jgi:hypothetical protein
MKKNDPMNYTEQIEEHYSAIWSPPVARIRWDKGPTGDLPEEFKVIVVQRSADTTAYATLCMSQPEDDERIELHLLTRRSEQVRDELVELLTAVAQYHRTGQRLGPGHSVNFGRPWLEGSACTHGLISLPYLDGPALERLDAPSVRFLWLIPVTEDEVSFKKRNGLEALEQRFEDMPFDYLDPLRVSVV